MAPALTEPLNPTEKLTNCAETSASPSSAPVPTPAKKSIGKLQRGSFTSLASTKRTRETCTKFANLKRSVYSKPFAVQRNANKSVKSAKRLKLLKSSHTSGKSNSIAECISGGAFEGETTIQRISASTSKNIPNHSIIVESKSDEQMGLNVAQHCSPSTKTNINTTSSTNAKKTRENILIRKGNSTAQLIADLTNETISADICLRNQLKDFNLQKISNSKILTRKHSLTNVNDTDCKTNRLLKRAKSANGKLKISYMDSVQSGEKLKHSYDEAENEEHTVQYVQKASAANRRNSSCCKADDTEMAVEVEANEEIEGDSNLVEECDSSMASSMLSSYSETEPKTRNTSKCEIKLVEELPPINTDSTMTASEVEDNLEERLSQLDGTAIDSPPLNDDEVTNKNSNAKSNNKTIGPESQQLINFVDTTHHSDNQQQQIKSSNASLPTNVSACTSVTKDADTELEDQDIEDVFKVLKGFEGGGTSDLSISDLNVLFNEVYTSLKMNEAEGVSSNQQTTPQPPIEIQSIQVVEPAQTHHSNLEIEIQQQQMEFKIDQLLQCLRKLQARYMCKHTSEEIAGLFEWSARHSNNKYDASSMNSTISGVTLDSDNENNENSNKFTQKVADSRPPATIWNEKKDNPLSIGQVNTLLRKIETAANNQQICRMAKSKYMPPPLQHKKSKKSAIDMQTTSTSSSINSITSPSSLITNNKPEEVVVPTFDCEVSEELAQVSGLLQNEMLQVQRAIDSDATESSSGDESTDEMVPYNNPYQQSLPITKRAAWRFYCARAAIAARWSWLQSQIADLEIKIRQHNELHQEIIATKGSVICDAPGNENTNSPPGNGAEKEQNELLGACRTRGYLSSNFRKRKLVQTANLHVISKKAARPSTIKCGCLWPQQQCALCTGRPDPTAPRDLPDTMTMQDRIALLDPGYHPVLSFPEDVNSAIHLEAISRLPEWQQRMVRCQVKTIAKNIWRSHRLSIGSQPSKRNSSSDALNSKRKYIKRRDRGIDDDNNEAVTPNALESMQAIPTSSHMGNGTASLTTTTTSTTPLVANKMMRKRTRKSISSCMEENAVLREPLTWPALNNSGATEYSNSRHASHMTSPYLSQNCDLYNSNQIHSPMILPTSTNKSNKYRKVTATQTSQTQWPASNNYTGITSLNSTMYSNGCSDNWTIDGFNNRSRASSPTHHRHERSHDRRNRSSYDIDNIVIPHSVAASTRVEILPYKEIPTPKWRIIESEGENSDKNKCDNDLVADVEKPKSPTTIPVSQLAPPPTTKLTSSPLLPTATTSPTPALTITNGTNHNKAACNIEDNDIPSISNGRLTELRSQRKRQSADDTDSNVAKGNVSLQQNELPTEASATLNNVLKANSLKIEQNSDFNERSKSDKEITTNNQSPMTLKAKENSKHISIAKKTKTEEVMNGKYLEDISDEAMIRRHERALAEERRKFQTYLKFPWSTRSRANRRVNSCAGSSGANTPDPCSPAPQLVNGTGGDPDSISSPMAPSTPLNALDTISEPGDSSSSFLGINLTSNPGNKRKQRTRTISVRRERDLDLCSSTPDPKDQLIPPYEPLKFPLNDEQFEELLRAMPNDHHVESNRFDNCYLATKYTKLPHSGQAHGQMQSKRNRCSSYSSNINANNYRRRKGGGPKGLMTNADSMLINANGNAIPLYYDDDDDDDSGYRKHPLIPKDDMRYNEDEDEDDEYADIGDDDDDDADSDFYYDRRYKDYIRQQKRRQRYILGCYDRDIDGDSSDSEPFGDEDPNDPEWREEQTTIYNLVDETFLAAATHNFKSKNSFPGSKLDDDYLYVD